MTVQDLSLVPGRGKLVDAVCYGGSFFRLQFALHKILGFGDVLKTVAALHSLLSVSGCILTLVPCLSSYILLLA